MSKRSRSLRAIQSTAFLLLIILQACGGDRNLEDYRKDKLDQDIGKLQPAEGVYSGKVYSKTGNNELGTLELALTAQTRVTDGSQSAKAERQALLTTKMTFFAQRTMVLLANDSYFDPDTGAYQATVSSQSSASATTKQQLSLTGMFSNGKIEGIIEAPGYPENGGRFVLEKKAGATNSGVSGGLSQGRTNEEQVKAIMSSYNGVTTFTNGVVRPVQFLILKPDQTPEEELLELFSPLKHVQVTLNYGDSIQLIHSNARLDERTGKLSGTGELRTDGSKTVVNLDCDRTQDMGWNCRHIASSAGLTATTNVNGQTDGASVAPTLPSETREAVVDTLQGEVRFSGNVSRIATLNVLHPRKPRAVELGEYFVPNPQEQVQLSLNFGNSFQVAVNNAMLDNEAGVLTGQFPLNRSASAGGGVQLGSMVVTLDCKRVTAGGTKGWDCNYFTSAQGLTAKSRFTPGNGANLPADNGEARKLVRKTYRGTADLRGVKLVSPVAEMVVTYPARTLQEEVFELFFPDANKTVQVTLVYNKHANQLFNQVTWDLHLKTLDAENSTSGKDAFNDTFRCQNFDLFATEAEEITCQVLNSRLNAPIEFRFTQVSTADSDPSKK